AKCNRPVFPGNLGELFAVSVKHKNAHIPVANSRAQSNARDRGHGRTPATETCLAYPLPPLPRKPAPPRPDSPGPRSGTSTQSAGWPIVPRLPYALESHTAREPLASHSYLIRLPIFYRPCPTQKCHCPVLGSN